MSTIINDLLLEQVYLLESIGWNAYIDADYYKGIDVFHQLIKLSEKLNFSEMIVRGKFMKSECLKSTGKYKQALAEAMETVKTKYKNADPRDMFNIYTNIISIGLSMPTSIQTIENALNQADTYLSQVGNMFWKAKTLLLRSNLARNRGDFQQALEYLQQGWVLSKNSYPAYANDTFMKNFVYLFIHLKDFDKVNEYFYRWEQLTDDQPMRRLKRLTLRKIMYYRAIKDKTTSLALARKFVATFPQPNDSYVLIDCLIANGFVELGNSLLAKYLLLNRASESLYQQKYNFTLLGDYYINKACVNQNLPTYDIRFSCDIISASLIKGCNETRKAKRAYLSALSYAQKIDYALNCSFNEQQMKERINLLKNVSD